MCAHACVCVCACIVYSIMFTEAPVIRWFPILSLGPVWGLANVNTM